MSKRETFAWIVALAAISAAPGTAVAATDSGELGSQLNPLRSIASGEIAEARDSGVTVENGRALVDVYVSGGLAGATDRLESIGMAVKATATEPMTVLEGWLPLDALGDGEALGITDAIVPVTGGGTDVGSVTSAGVAAHNTPQASAVLGTTGVGIDVGVISDSINQVGAAVNGSQASGDLPADPNVVVLSDDTTSPSDEGRAMAEIIYDEAPGLNRILFASGTATGSVGKAAAIDSLVATGADVIADDIFYLSEPAFQDGPVAQAVDRARAAGVAYFASAGNRARQSYESTYRPSGNLHDFDPGAGVDTRACFSNPVPNTSPDSFIQVALHWDQPLGNVTTDMDLRITDTAGGVLASATENNITNDLPRTIATFVNPGAAVIPCVEIVRFAGPNPGFIKWIQHDNYAPGDPEFDTNSNAINPDAASAAGSMSVAAVSAGDAGLNTPESFSSRGPNTRLFDAAGNRLATPEIRFNPDLAAADQVNTSVPGFAPFGGTSAAAPSAAGIAALLRSANPQATINEIYAQMSAPANAIECTASAVFPDPDCGAGFILANVAAARLDRTGVVVAPGTIPAEPTGKNGWYTDDLIVDFNVNDPESPIETNCPDVPVTTDGVQTFTCSALSGGGPGTGTLTVQRDAEPPKKPKIKGIKKRGNPPPKKKIKCKSSDATSGLDKCKIKGYSKASGKHKLKATATDEAGLKSKSKFKYRVP